MKNAQRSSQVAKVQPAARLIDLVYDGLAMPSVRLFAPLLHHLHHRLSHWWHEASATLVEVRRLPDAERRLWIHAASMGELEQMLPIVHALKDVDASLHVVATVTSTSAIEHARKSPLLDAAFLLPVDDLRLMRTLVAAMQARVLVFGRYDLWRSLVRAADEVHLPIVVVNATMPQTGRGGALQQWTADTYQRLSAILAINDEEHSDLHALAPDVPCMVVPDSRVDRVLDRIDHPSLDLTSWRSPGDVLTLVVGSSWPEDLDLLQEALRGIDHPPRILIVPHILDEEHIKKACSQFHAIRFSTSAPSPTSAVVFDVMGALIDIYQLGTVAYVGGGFGAGVHSTTEPACCNLPIACGPQIHRSGDARELAQSGVLTIVQTADELRSWILSMQNASNRAALSAQAQTWCHSRRGAARRAADTIVHYL